MGVLRETSWGQTYQSMACHVKRDVADAAAGVENRGPLGQVEPLEHLLLHSSQGGRDWEWEPCVVVPVAFLCQRDRSRRHRKEKAPSKIAPFKRVYEDNYARSFVTRKEHPMDDGRPSIGSFCGNPARNTLLPPHQEQDPSSVWLAQQVVHGNGYVIVDCLSSPAQHTLW